MANLLTLNFYFKSRFSAKPSKFQIYFTITCRVIQICRIPWWCSLFCFRLEIHFWANLVTLNFYFKSRFSAKPSKFQIYFTIDCRVIMQKISGQKNSNCLFKQKFGTKTNLNMRNSMMTFTFSVFDYEYLLWANLVQRFKTVCSNLNLIQWLIQTYKTQWWCLFYLF